MKIINTKNAPAAIGPYSQAIAANGLLFVSGQIPFDPKTMKTVTGIKNQTKQSLENLKSIIVEAGVTLKDVIKVNIFIKNMDDFGEINEVYATYFSDHKPARACVEVARLPKDVEIEIEAVVKMQGCCNLAKDCCKDEKDCCNLDKDCCKDKKDCCNEKN